MKAKLGLGPQRGALAESGVGPAAIHAAVQRENPSGAGAPRGAPRGVGGGDPRHSRKPVSVKAKLGLGPRRGALAELGVGPAGIPFPAGGGLQQTPLNHSGAKARSMSSCCSSRWLLGEPVAGLADSSRVTPDRG